MKKIECFPEWLNNLPDRTLLTAKDLMVIYGYKTAQSVHCAVKRGQIPPNDRCIPHSGNKGGKKELFYWRLGVIRNLYKQQAAA